MPSVSVSLARRCGAEILGTFLLVFFGLGAVHVAVLTGALAGLGQVALVWAFAVTLAIYTVGQISGAHINPAMTLAFACWRGFPWSSVIPYFLAQTLGAFLAAAVLFGLFQDLLLAKEREKSVVRGQPGSEVTAMCYGEYFPNPGPLAASPGSYDAAEHTRFNELVSEYSACFAEFLGTGILALLVFALTDPHNTVAPAGNLAPAFIGLTVGILICVIAPLTQACFNPARDFGPRLLACVAGWGEIALPGPRGLGFLTVYILAPSCGAIAGGALYTKGLQPCAQPS